MRAGLGLSGSVIGWTLLDHYSDRLRELRRVGYARYARTQLEPYIRAAAAHLSPSRRTFTERLLDRLGIDA